MIDRERLRRLTASGDFGAARELAREYRRSPTDEDGMVLASSDWVQLRTRVASDYGAWQKFAEMLLKFPDPEDYDHLDNAGRSHLMIYGATDVMDAALGKIRRLLSIPEPFSLRNNPRFGRRR